MATRSRPGVVGAIRIDVQRLHDTWMELVFPRQLDPSSVLGKWRPDTTPQRIAYWTWAALGIPLVALGYPLLLVGVATRYQVRQLNSATARLGLLGAVGVVALAWGLLTVVTHLSRLPFDAFLAVGAASVVAIVSTALAVVFSRVDGRPVSVVLAYPFAMTALFLPPVVAALVTPTLQAIVFPPSYDLANWILDTILFVGGLNDWLRAAFDLNTFGTEYGLPGLGYVLMWFGIAVPIGWLLGVLVALADLVRPHQE